MSKQSGEHLLLWSMLAGLLLGAAGGIIFGFATQNFPRGVGIGLGGGFILGMAAGLLLERLLEGGNNQWLS